MTTPLIIFSHGQDGSPKGAKIGAMAEVARRRGFQYESLDYQGMAPADRVAKLLAFGRTVAAAPVLVGSSLGGHVATAASIALRARGLFLLAPAFYMPGFEEHTPKPAACPVSILHGWRDDIVPVDNSIRYAREYRARLHIIDSDHRMLEQMDLIVAYFDLFLSGLVNT